VWLLDTSKPKHTIEATYLTGGIGWRSDYVAVLSADDSKTDLSGWVTIDNQSGATYENASLKLVAGDVHRAEPEYAPAAMGDVMAVRGVAKEEQFREESFFEYHLYTLERPATVKDRQTKQISLLSAEGAKVKKTFVVQPQYAYWFVRADAVEKPKVGVFVSLDNSKKNGMGMPLPKGIVRVYKKDSAGSLQFIGEDRIDHTPEEETIRIAAARSPGPRARVPRPGTPPRRACRSAASGDRSRSRGPRRAPSAGRARGWRCRAERADRPRRSRPAARGTRRPPCSPRDRCARARRR
jgi:hypothetical protein